MRDLMESHARRLEEERSYLEQRLERYRAIYDELRA